RGPGTCHSGSISGARPASPGTRTWPRVPRLRVTRTRQSGDGRVVLVDLTDSGNVALGDYRGRLRAVLGGYLAEIADEQVAALATATETLAQLVDVLQQRPAR